MSTQITLPAERRTPFGRGWLAAILLAASLGVAATTFLTLRSDGAARPKPAVVTPAAKLPSGAFTQPGSGQVGITNAPAGAVLPNAHDSAGFKRAAERSGWTGPGSVPGRGSDAGCTIIGGRQAC